MDLNLLPAAATQLERLKARSLWVGFSGGLDSSALLHWLAAQPVARALGLRAIHIDHQLHPASADWALHCQQRAARWGVDCVVQAVTVDRGAAGGLEQAAREARHAAFRSLLAEHDVLALAHHRDDQIETLLLRLARGGGGDALAGMAAARRLGAGWLWRPWLEIPRERLQHYAERHGLEWIDDPSNADTAHDRNFLRHAVLPLLRRRWPGFDQAAASSLQRLRADQRSLAQRDLGDLSQAQSLRPQLLRWPTLPLNDAHRLGRVIRLWCDQQALPRPPSAVIERLALALAVADQGGEPIVLRWRGGRLRQHRDLLHLDAGVAVPPLAPTPWRGGAQLELPGWGRWQLDRAPSAARDWLIGPRRGGERIRLPGRAHSSRLKQVLQALGLPPWERERLPLLWSAAGDELLAAGDLVISDRLQRWLQEHGSRLRWLTERENPAEQAHSR